MMCIYKNFTIICAFCNFWYGICLNLKQLKNKQKEE